MSTHDLSQVVTVLVVPEKDDPLRLLREGPYGARPPTMTLATCGNDDCQDARWVDPPSHGLHSPCSCSTDHGTVWLHLTDTRALVLWSCMIVPEGMDRLLRAHDRAPHHLKGWTVRDVLLAAMLNTLSNGSDLKAVDARGRTLPLEGLLS